MLENWKQFIHKDDFDDLFSFVENTKSGIKEPTICILFGKKNTGKSTFVAELSKYVGQSNVHFKQIGFLKRPTTGITSKLIVIKNPEHFEFDDCVPHIKEYLTDEIIYRRPYTIQTRANILILTNDLNFFEDFTKQTKEKFKIIRFINVFE